MTGMGRARGKAGSSHFLVEIKSVNHRYCEVQTRLPHSLSSLELPIVQLVKKTIHRGKVDVWIGEEKGGEAGLALNEKNKKALFGYWRFLNGVRRHLKLAESVTLAHLQAGAPFWMGSPPGAEKIGPALKRLIIRALAELNRMRKREGENLRVNIASRLKLIEELAQKTALNKEGIVQQNKMKLESRIQRLLSGMEAVAAPAGPVAPALPVDAGKLAMEVAFIADRSDITEELERLSSHFGQARKLLKSLKPVGRPLDFLIQEMNREWNTIASKTQNAEAAQTVVSAKCEMEKIREQVQNIE